MSTRNARCAARFRLALTRQPWTSTKWVPPGYAHREDAAASENKASDQATLVEHASEDGEAKHNGKKEPGNVV